MKLEGAPLAAIASELRRRKRTCGACGGDGVVGRDYDGTDASAPGEGGCPYCNGCGYRSVPGLSEAADRLEKLDE